MTFRVIAPVARDLDDRRRKLVEPMLLRHASEISMARAGMHRLLDADTSASARAEIRAHVDRLATLLLNELRSADVGAPLATAADAFMRTERTELMDSKGVPALVKALEVRALDWQNRLLGVYKDWVSFVVDARGDAAASGTIYELAGGSGGFAQFLASRIDAPVVCSDINTDTLLARSKEMPSLRFEARDAREIAHLTGVDLFVCFQSGHHFSAGMLVEIIHAAIQSAPRGILIVDLMRSMMLQAAGIFVDLFTAPFPPFMVDGFISFGRSFTPAEFSLVAQLAGARIVECRFHPPAYVVLRAVKA